MFPPFQAHYDVLSVVLLLGGGYWWAEKRYRPRFHPTATPATRRQWWSWYLGLFFLMLASWWPMHDLAETKLFSAHMLEHMILGYVVPPFLLQGLTRWMADSTLGNRKLVPWLRPLCNPVVGFFAFNTVLVGIHWPQAITWQVQSEGVHFALHALLFVTAVLLWMPLYSPTPAIPRMGRPMAMLYLFLNTLIPTVPASFLTFSHEPLFPVYGSGPQAWGLTLLGDQVIGGILMKLGGGFLLLGRILAMWLEYNRDERKWDEIERNLVEEPARKA